MVKRSKLSAAEADLLAMKLRRENMVASHKAMMEEYKVRKMIKDAERIKNYQSQYGALQEAPARLPLGLQTTSLRRMQDLGKMLKFYQQIYSNYFPQGPGPNTNRLEEIRRRTA